MSGFVEYPKAMHGPDGAEATVNSAEEEKALGKDWIDGHEHWAAKAASVDDEGAEGGESTQGDVNLSTLNKAQLVAHGLEFHGLKLTPAMNKPQCVAAIEAARAAVVETGAGEEEQSEVAGAE